MYLLKEEYVLIVNSNPSARDRVITLALEGFDTRYERCVPKPPKSYHLKIISSAFSTR